MVRQPEMLSAPDAQLLTYIRQDAEVERSYGLAQHFLPLIRQRRPDQFNRWLENCQTSQVAELQLFAAGLQQDYAAVRAALTEQWSTGPVEGHINRVKLIKRQMFGRAKFDLLKQRVLHAA